MQAHQLHSLPPSLLFSPPCCHPLSPFFLFLRTLVRSLCAACACVRACWCSGRIVSAAGVRAFDPPCLCVCVCLSKGCFLCVPCMPCSAFITVYFCFVFVCWCVAAAWLLQARARQINSQHSQAYALNTRWLKKQKRREGEVWWCGCAWLCVVVIFFYSFFFLQLQRALCAGGVGRG